MWFGTKRVVSLSLHSIHKVSISSPYPPGRRKKNYLSFQQKALTPSVSLWLSPQLCPSTSLWLWEDKHQAFQRSLAASNEYFQWEKTVDALSHFVGLFQGCTLQPMLLFDCAAALRVTKQNKNNFTMRLLQLLMWPYECLSSLLLIKRLTLQ